jgi:hypothetical protein
MSTLGMIHMNSDDGEEEVTSRPPLREIVQRPIKTEILRFDTPIKKWELLTLKQMR